MSLNRQVHLGLPRRREGGVELVPAELGGQFDLMLKLKRMLDPNNIMDGQVPARPGLRGRGGLSMPEDQRLPPGVVDEAATTRSTRP